jgi:serine/threonine protein kinase
MSIRRNAESSSAGGSTLGAYALGSSLHEGKLSVVQLARPLAPHNVPEDVVIRRLSPLHRNNDESRELLLVAGRIAQAIDSPHIVKALGVFTTPEVFLVLEHVSGLSLSHIADNARSALPARCIIRVYLDVLLALETLHRLRELPGTQSRYVHGAPVPRHILVGHDGLTKLTDMSHVVGAGLPWVPGLDERLRVTEMAPEQMLAPSTVAPTCDLFIVAAGLWQSITGRSPFHDDAPSEFARNIARARIARPGELSLVSSEAVENVCRRALHRVRSERYGSAAEMAHELEAAAARLGLIADRAEVAAWLNAARQQTRGRALSRGATRAMGTLIGLGPGSRDLQKRPVTRALNETSDNFWRPDSQPSGTAALRPRLVRTAIVGCAAVLGLIAIVRGGSLNAAGNNRTAAGAHIPLTAPSEVRTKRAPSQQIEAPGAATTAPNIPLRALPSRGAGSSSESNAGPIALQDAHEKAASAQRAPRPSRPEAQPIVSKRAREETSRSPGRPRTQASGDAPQVFRTLKDPGLPENPY